MPPTEHRTVTPKAQEETVYIVDDEEPLRRSLKYLLESVKLRVEAFDSAETLLKSLTLRSHGCIVLDVRMPGMSGPELMDHLIERGFAMLKLRRKLLSDVLLADKASHIGKRA